MHLACSAGAAAVNAKRKGTRNGGVEGWGRRVWSRRVRHGTIVLVSVKSNAWPPAHELEALKALAGAAGNGSARASFPRRATAAGRAGNNVRALSAAAVVGVGNDESRSSVRLGSWALSAGDSRTGAVGQAPGAAAVLVPLGGRPHGRGVDLRGNRSGSDWRARSGAVVDWDGVERGRRFRLGRVDARARAVEASARLD